MIQSRQNLVTDGRTDRQTDESDFIGRCPTDVERPTAILLLTDTSNRNNEATKFRKKKWRTKL